MFPSSPKCSSSMLAGFNDAASNCKIYYHMKGKVMVMVMVMEVMVVMMLVIVMVILIKELFLSEQSKLYHKF